MSGLGGLPTITIPNLPNSNMANLAASFMDNASKSIAGIADRWHKRVENEAQIEQKDRELRESARATDLADKAAWGRIKADILNNERSTAAQLEAARTHAAASIRAAQIQAETSRLRLKAELEPRIRAEEGDKFVQEFMQGITDKQNNNEQVLGKQKGIWEQSAEETNRLYEELQKVGNQLDGLNTELAPLTKAQEKLAKLPDVSISYNGEVDNAQQEVANLTNQFSDALKKRDNLKKQYEALTAAYNKSKATTDAAGNEYNRMTQEFTKGVPTATSLLSDIKAAAVQRGIDVTNSSFYKLLKDSAENEAALTVRTQEQNKQAQIALGAASKELDDSLNERNLTPESKSTARSIVDSIANLQGISDDARIRRILALKVGKRIVENENTRTGWLDFSGTRRFGNNLSDFNGTKIPDIRQALMSAKSVDDLKKSNLELYNLIQGVYTEVAPSSTRPY